MAYLSLFTFAMLMLVTSDNFLQLFFGWEGVGLCSYFLIGFWFKKESANAAAIKAFVVNRVGDFGFALGIFLIFYLFGTVNYDEVFQQVEAIDRVNARKLYKQGLKPTHARVPKVRMDSPLTRQSFLLGISHSRL